MITVVELVGYLPVWSPCLADQAMTVTMTSAGPKNASITADCRYTTSTASTTGGFDVRVVDIAVMDSDYCDRGVQRAAVHRASAP